MNNRSGTAVAIRAEHKSVILVRSAILSALTGLALMIGIGHPLAQDQNNDLQRYSMEKTAAGIVRLDRQTGEVALCQEQSGKIACAQTKPAQLNSEERIFLLEKQVADLTTRLTKLENSGTAANATSGLPSEAEFEKGLSYMERFMRAFMGIAKSLDEPEPAPNRT